MPSRAQARRARARARAERKAREDAPSPVVRATGVALLACLLVAVLLGLAKTGEPLWRDARLFFLPAGVLMILQSTLLNGRRSHPMVAIDPNPLLAPSLFAIGLGLVGLGLEELDPARPWSLLTIPMTVLLGWLSLREARKGPESDLVRRGEGRLARFNLRAGLWCGGVLWPAFVLWALGIYDPRD